MTLPQTEKRRKKKRTSIGCCGTVLLVHLQVCKARQDKTALTKYSIFPNDVQYMVNGRRGRAVYCYFNLHSCSKALYGNLMSSGYHSSPYHIITWDQHYMIKVKEKALILFISHLPQTIIIYLGPKVQFPF